MIIHYYDAPSPDTFNGRRVHTRDSAGTRSSRECSRLAIAPTFDRRVGITHNCYCRRHVVMLEETCSSHSKNCNPFRLNSYLLSVLINTVTQWLSFIIKSRIKYIYSVC